MVIANKKDLGQILLDRESIKWPELQAAKETALRTGKKLAEVLLSQNLVTPETLATVLSFQYGAPIIDLEGCKIQPKALAIIPEEVAFKHSILPLAINGNVLTVAMADPGDFQAIDTLSSWSRKRIRPVVSLHGGIEKAIAEHYGGSAKA